jgi:hypothetical protein
MSRPAALRRECSEWSLAESYLLLMHVHVQALQLFFCRQSSYCMHVAHTQRLSTHVLLYALKSLHSSFVLSQMLHMFCRQARKLQEMFQKVQQENEMLRSGRRPGNAIQMGSGSGQQFNDLLSPAHNMRHLSNAPGSGRVVCISALLIVYTWQLPAAWGIATSTYGRMLCKESAHKAVARHQHTKIMLLWCIDSLYMAMISSLACCNICVQGNSKASAYKEYASLVYRWSIHGNCEQPGVLQHLQLCLLTCIVHKHAMVAGKCFMHTTSELHMCH